MRKFILIVLAAFMSVGTFGRNAVRVDNIYDMIFFSDTNVLGRWPIRDNDLRRSVIPDSIADRIIMCDTIYVLSYYESSPINSLHEVWRYGDICLEYNVAVNDGSVLSMTESDKSEILDKILAKDLIQKSRPKDIVLQSMSVYSFVRRSPTLFEFERRYYRADLNKGEVYDPDYK